MFKWERIDPKAPTNRADFVRVWTTELFNPARKQEIGELKKVKTGGNCCLGVSCEVAKLPVIKDKRQKTYFYGTEKTDNQYLPKELVNFLQMNYTGEMQCDQRFVSGKGYVYPDNYYAATKLLNGEEKLTEANDNRTPFYKIAKALILYPEIFMSNMSKKEIEYINATPIPTWQDYSAARKAHNDSLKANKGDNHDSV